MFISLNHIQSVPVGNVKTHLILGAILSKKCYINMGQIHNGYRDMQVSAFG
jgi:hypothetical protein